MNDAHSGKYRLVRNDKSQHIGKGPFKLVRVLIAQAGGKRTLGVYVHQEDLLAFPCQPDSQIDRCYSFSNSAFLVADCRDFGFFAHFGLLLCS